MFTNTKNIKMRLLKILFLYFAFIVFVFAVVSFHVSPEDWSQIGDAVTPCGLVVHVLLVCTSLMIYIEITDKRTGI